MKIREAITVLQDETKSAVYQYQKCWDVILTGLKSTEPATRFQVLKGLSQVIQKDSVDGLRMLLCDITVGDELERNRNVAAIVLGTCLQGSKEEGLGFKSILCHFFFYFPKDPNEFDAKQATTRNQFQGRIYAIHALSLCFNIASIQTNDFLSYIDQLFVRILEGNPHPLLACAVVKALARLERTNRNRIRIETFYRKLVFEVVHTPSSSKTCSFQLKEAYNHFIGIWFPIPSDSDICFAIVDQETELGSFAEKRKGYISSLDDSETIFEECSEEEKQALIQKASLAPYKRNETICYQLEMFDKIKRDIDQITETWLEIDKIPTDPVQVPPKNVLKFKLKVPVIEFHMNPQSIKVFLENTTTNDQYFSMQVSHPELFSVKPAYGTIEQLKSLQIVVQVRPNIVLPPGKIRGYIYVRNERGFPIERVTLSAMNLPAIRPSSTILDFGVCPSLETRSMSLVLTNLVSTDCPVVMIIAPTKTSSTFQIQQTQATIPAQESKVITIRATPDQEGLITDVLYLVALGGQLMKIELRMQCGESLETIETDLNFGFADIFFDPIVKKINLRNRDGRHRLPVTFQCSTNEVTVNGGKPVILAPGEERSVLVSFKSSMTGNRLETLTVFAPHSLPHKIKVTAFSGPYLKLPCFEELYFPATLLGDVAFLRFPVSNLFHEVAQVNITIPTGYPVSLQTLPFDYANSFTGDFQSKSFSNGKSDTLKLSLPPFATVVIEVAFTASLTGYFKIPMYTSVVKPTKMDISTNYLMVSCFSDNSLTKTLSSVQEYQNWATKPYYCPNTLPSVFLQRETLHSKRPVSQVFQLEPAMKMVFGPIATSRPLESLDFVHLINVTKQVQRYRLVLSSHFKTDIPLEGELPPNSFLDISIRVDPNISFSPESKFFTVFGFITVLDCNFSDPGLLTCQLYGVIGDQLCLEVRKEEQEILFAETLLMEQTQRRIFFRNKLPAPVTVDVALECMQFDQVANGVYNPFITPSKQVVVKPFGLAYLDIPFKPIAHGDFKSKFTLSYPDPNYTNEISQKTRGPKMKSIPAIYFCASVNQHEFQQSPEVLVFGDVDIRDVGQHELTLENHNQAKESVLLASSGAIVIHPNQLLMEGESAEKIQVNIEPYNHGVIQDMVSFDIGGSTHCVNVVANVGTMNLESHIVQLASYGSSENVHDKIPPSESILDIGNICIGDDKSKVLDFRNHGTLDILLSKPEFGESNVTFEPIYQHFVGTISDANRISFGPENLDQHEMDWEHFMFLKESKTLLTAYFPSKKSRLQSQRIGSIFEGSSKYSSLFPSKALVKDDSPKIGGIPLNHLFPYRLLPHQVAKVDIKFMSDHLGPFSIPMRMKVNQTNATSRQYVVWLQGAVQRPLILNTKVFDFGTCPINHEQKALVKFTNEENVPISWSLQHDLTKIVPLDNFDFTYEKFLKHPRCPVKIFPISGVLAKGSTQVVEILFTPSVPQAETMTVLKLVSGDYNSQDIMIQSIGGSAILEVKPSSLDFGTIRTGMKKSIPIQISNPGILPFNYHIESTDPDFVVEPEQGKVNGESKVKLIVKYHPKKEGRNKGKLIVNAFAPNTIRPFLISLDGQASYPKLVVLTKVLDFGTALFKNANRRKIEVKNMGAADGKVVFECNHPNIVMEDLGDSLTVKPNETKEITIIYTPTVVEKLNAKAFIHSCDNRGETFMVMFKGNVGIPKLTVVPDKALEQLDFGVVLLNTAKTQKFTIVNEGTIFLNFNTRLNQLDVRQIEHFNMDDKRRSIGNTTCPIQVEPDQGRLAVGESMEICVTFLPSLLAEFEYEFVLAYEYQEFSAIIKGSGGKPHSKILSPFSLFDFELCRVGRVYEKVIAFANEGNLGMGFIVRPEPENGDWTVYERPETAEDSFWVTELQKLGLSIVHQSGYSNAKSNFSIKIVYAPTTDQKITKMFRFYQDGRFVPFEIRARSAIPSLQLSDPKTGLLIGPGQTPEIKVGVHPVKSVFMYTLSLINTGPFGIDFLVQPMSTIEYDVYPLRGYIEPNSSVPVSLSFQPSSEGTFHTTLKILWEGQPVCAKIFGNGGIGRLEMKFLEDKDAQIKMLDYGMIPFNTPAKKRFFIINSGMVGIKANLQVENEDYALCLVGDPIAIGDIQKVKAQSKVTFSTWFNNQKVYLEPNTAVQIGVRFLPTSATTSVGDITVRSDSGSFTIPLKGKGGTLTLSHKGDLDFGDISCNYTYSRKITIANGGSIPATLQVSWLIVGISNETDPHIKLGEVYTNIDPRSQLTRKMFVEEHPHLNFNSKLSASDYWALIALMVRRNLAKGSSVSNSSVGQSGSKLFNPSRRSMGNSVSSHFKRRQIFLHLISSTQLTSQSSSLVKPFIKITPPIAQLPSYGDAQFLVELNLGSEDTFLATLVVKPDITNSPKYEIPLTATPKLVNILCDDTRMLNFYRQPVGETEVIVRKFSNVGHKDVPFKFHNPNSGLTISPSKGILKIGQTINVTFSFTPTDETTQSGDVILDPLYSQPVRFKMFGGGGYAKASLSRYRRFDFGHCMIGKDTISYLPIVNEGNAILHLNRFELQDTDTFFKGQDWPKGRISLFPGKNYSLPLVFHPQEENPLSGNLIIGSNSENFEIELIGLGREAVLIVSKVALEFHECLMGNTYEQKLGLKNIGDVNYPVSCHLDKEFPDITFSPSSLVISPFSESFVTITYSPSHQTKATTIFTLASPYSSHKVPIMVHAGNATLEFNSTDLDFGMFERTTQPSIILTMKNSGTVKTNFQLKDTTKPSIFTIEPSKGILLAKKSIDVKITHIRHEVSEFKEKIAIKTDLVDKIYNISIKGQCEETVLRPQEFSMLNIGVCPVLEPTTKALQFKNYGKFPLSFTVPSAYPLKVSPVEGVVEGGETGTINITWSPSGGYELRTHLNISTNIGKFPILVRGKSMFPEVVISTQYIEFGVCALGYSYHQFFTIENKGKVKLNFAIPSCKEPSFVSSISSGSIEPKKSVVVDLLFTPRQLGKLQGSLLVDCKGIHFKEIILAGMGGVMLTDVFPQNIDLERCPYGLPRYETVQITNNGDITLHLDFSKTKIEQGPCKITLPEPFSIAPSQTGNCVFGFSAFTIDRFYAKVTICTIEQTFTIPVTGVGVKINLSQKSKKILSTEKFATVKEPMAFYVEPEYIPIDFAVKRLQPNYEIGVEFFDLLSIIYQQAETKREVYTDPNQMEFVADKRISFLHENVNIGSSSRAFKTVAETKEPMLVPVVLEDSLESQNEQVQQRDSLVDCSSKRVSIAVPETEPVADSLDPNKERPSSRGSIYSTEANAGELTPFPTSERKTPEESLLNVRPRSRSRASSSAGRRKSVVEGRSSTRERKKSTVFEQDRLQALKDDPILSLDISNNQQGLQKLLGVLKEHYDPFGEPKMDKIDKIAEKFVIVKQRNVEQMEPTDDDAQKVIEYAQLKIDQIDIDPILEPQSDFDWVDITFLTQRPPPFQREKEIESMAIKSKKALEARKMYMAHFPKLNRTERNAKAHPFENAKSIGYGQGVRLYKNND